MSHRHDKKGPELLIPSTDLIEQVIEIGKMCKLNHDNHHHNIMLTVVAVLTKYQAAAKTVAEVVALQRSVAKTLTDSADYLEQLFPKTGGATE